MRIWTLCLLLVLLAAVDLGSAQAALADWQPGPNAILDNTYSGFIDVPVSETMLPVGQPVLVAGWVVDRDAEGWAGIDNVHVYEGLAGEGGRFLGQATFALPRPDVAQVLGNPFWTNSGFALSLGAGALPAGPHTLTVYAHTAGKGWWFQQVSINVAGQPSAQAPATSASAPPVNVLVRPSMVTISKQEDHYSIKGYALEPSAPGNGDNGIDHVDLYMDEQRGHGGTFIGRASLGQDSPEAVAVYGERFLKAGYQLDFKPANFGAGNHHIYAYAVSSITGLESVALTGFDISR